MLWNQTLVHSPDPQQRRSINTKLWWRKVQCWLQGIRQLMLKRTELADGVQGKVSEGLVRDEGCRMPGQLLHILLTTVPSCEWGACQPKDARISKGVALTFSRISLFLAQEKLVHSFHPVMCNWGITLTIFRGSPQTYFRQDCAITLFWHLFIIPFRVPYLTLLPTNPMCACSAAKLCLTLRPHGL